MSFVEFSRFLCLVGYSDGSCGVLSLCKGWPNKRIGRTEGKGGEGEGRSVVVFGGDS